MASRLPIYRFSTDRFLPCERHEAWMHRHWPSFSSAVVATPNGDFSAFSEEVGLGPATVFYGAFSAQTIHRTPKLVRTDGLDHLGLCIGLEGDMAGADYVVRPGGMLLSDLSRDMTHFSGDVRTITVALPRAMVMAAGIDPRRYHLSTFAAARVALLRSHLVQLRRSAPNLTTSDAPVLLRTIVDLLAVTLNDSGRPIGLSQEIADVGGRAKACALIERHIGNGALGADVLCRQLGMSRSALYRLFEDVGGIQTYIRNRRLELARQALLDRPEHTIADIADRLGFDDAAYFSRAFRQRFGLSPRDFRAHEASIDRL